MKRSVLLLVLCVFVGKTNAQDDFGKYNQLVLQADSLYKIRKYKDAAFTYLNAFAALGRKATAHDRYSAARCWALANYPDSAFYHLGRLADGVHYGNYDQLSSDKEFISLYNDRRWNTILAKVKENKEKAEAKINKPVKRVLDSIMEEDQKYRQMMDSVEKKFGWDSKQMKDLWKVTSKADAGNLKIVVAILDKYGWLGPEEVGGMGNSTLFLVIQHSDQKTQEKYLPMMREAVKNRKADASSLALLEDRVALGQGKKQIYGSQIGMKEGKYFLSPLEDPDNVDKRRAEVGLGPLQEYLNNWDLKWDVEEYKKSQKK